MKASGYAFGLTLLVAASAAHAEEAKDDGWRFIVAPYLWAAGIDGEAGVHGVKTDIDWSFSDILENLDMAFMGQFEAHKSKFGFVISPVYMDLSDDADGPLGFVKAKASLKVPIVDYFATWEVVPGLELMAGARTIKVKIELKLRNNITGESVSTDDDESWTDPIIGLRYAHDFDDHWSMNLRGDVGGGAGQSDFVWNALAAVGYKVGDSGRIYLGYRVLDYDYEDGDAADRYTFDIRVAGPVLGYAMTF